MQGGGDIDGPSRAVVGPVASGDREAVPFSKAKSRSGRGLPVSSPAPPQIRPQHPKPQLTFHLFTCSSGNSGILASRIYAIEGKYSLILLKTSLWQEPLTATERTSD